MITLQGAFRNVRLRLETILVDLQGSNLRLQCRPRDPQLGGGPLRTEYLAATLPQRSLDYVLFLRLQSLVQFGLVCRLRWNRLGQQPGLVDRKILCFAHDDRSLNHVLQFADVPWPGVGAKQVDAFFGYPAYALFHFPRAMIDEVFDQRRNVFSSFPQRRHINRENVEPVKQVTAKGSSRDGHLQVAVRGSNHSNICLDGSTSANTLEFVFLQDTQ